MELLKKQSENVKKLLDLIIKNPELKIMPMVNNEICQDDDYRYWMGNWGNAVIDYYWLGNDKINFKDDKEDLIEIVLDENPELTEEDAENIVDNYNWVKCIVVYIELPD